MAPPQTTPNPAPTQTPSRRKSDGGLSVKSRQQQRDAFEIEQMRNHLIEREALVNSVRAYKEHALRPGYRRAVTTLGQTRNSSPSSDFWSVVGNGESPREH